MARQPIPMSPNYLAVLRGVRELHRLAIAGREESPEADAIRDATDAPWEALSETERKRISGLSEDLYSISEPVEGAPPPMNPQAQARLADAYLATEHGDWDRALELLRRWGKYHPPAFLSYLRGHIWGEAGDPETAAWFFGHAAELEPENGSYLTFALDSLDLSGSPEALRRAEAILDRDEDYPAVAVARAAEIALKATQAIPESEAAAKYRRLMPILERTLARIEADTEGASFKLHYVIIMSVLGRSHEFLGEHQAAIQSYSRGLQVDPHDDALLTARGMLLYGTSPRAIADFERAIKLNSPMVWPYVFLAHHYLRSRRFEDCRTMCERAARMPASDMVRSELAEWKAISEAELGFPVEMVRASFEEAVRLDPSNDRARRNLSLVEAAARPAQPRAWETRQISAVRTSGLVARRIERVVA